MSVDKTVNELLHLYHRIVTGNYCNAFENAYIMDNTSI